jgi:hypothetical protein
MRWVKTTTGKTYVAAEKMSSVGHGKSGGANPPIEMEAVKGVYPIHTASLRGYLSIFINSRSGKEN